MARASLSGPRSSRRRWPSRSSRVLEGRATLRRCSSRDVSGKPPACPVIVGGPRADQECEGPHQSGEVLMKRILGLVLALSLGLLPSAFAQGAKGSIYGKIADESDAALPGSQVTLTGATIGAQTTHVTNQGDFRFLN